MSEHSMFCFNKLYQENAKDLISLLLLFKVIVEEVVKSSSTGLQMMYSRLLEFVPHHCRLLREVTGGAISRY